MKSTALQLLIYTAKSEGINSTERAKREQEHLTWPAVGTAGALTPIKENQRLSWLMIWVKYSPNFY